MDKSRLKKILIYGGIAIGVVVVIVVISMLTSSDNPTQTSGGLVSSNQTVPTVPAPANPAATSGSTQIVALLKNLSGIRLNDSLFLYPAFRTLQDISIVLPTPSSEGRQNPFAPIGTQTAAPVVEVDTVQ